MHNSLSPPRLWRSLLALLAGVLFFAVPAQADPAGRIGRIAWLSGDVNLYNPGTGESYSAPLNQPLTSGDILSIDANSRAEIQIGSMTVRLDMGSVLELDRIDDEQVRLFLNSGRAIVNLPSREAVGDFELGTRIGQFSARDTGIYRFDAESNSASGTAYYGRLHFEASDSALDIAAGQSAAFWNAGQTRYRLTTAINDDFTQWSAARDQRRTSNNYARYVSPEMTGAEDLDAYGNWSENPEYGAIWTPRAVAADWAPYRSGHWVWIAPWGWNWVGDEPWGFAPFHYGRWVQHRGAWGWVPGTRIARPVYAPAMVAWIGTPGLAPSLAIGARPTVGWFPLAPHEVYIPAYRSSPNHIRSINSSHVPHIANVNIIASNPQAVIQQTRYAHRELPQAVTVVPADVVTHRRPVAREVISHRDQRGMRDQPVQAAAPVSVPQTETRGRQERQDRPSQPSARPGREPQAPAVAPQRNERPVPESAHAVPSPRSEPVESRRQESAAPISTQVERRNPQDRASQPFARRDREQSEPRVATPAAPRNREAVIPQAVAPVPQAPAVVPHRMERSMPETVRPTPQARPEPAPQQVIRPAPAVRVEAPPPVVRETRREAPREVSRPAEPRPEARTQRADDRQRPAPEEKSPQRHGRGDEEKR